MQYALTVLVGGPLPFPIFAVCLMRNAATGLADENLFSHMLLTPMSVAIDAIREFVANPIMTGVTAEISGEKFTIREPPELVDEMTRKNFDTFWSLGYA